MADKTKTIKDATDKELDDLIVRLRKENEVQDLITALKRKSSNNFTPYDTPQVSTEIPIESLYHFGISGMKWGHRKSNSTISTPSEDHNKKMALKGKKISEMSNDELRTYTQRMALEKQVKELSKNDISAGKKFVNDIINSAKKGANDAAMNYINKKASKLIEDLIKKTTKAAT